MSEAVGGAGELMRAPHARPVFWRGLLVPFSLAYTGVVELRNLYYQQVKTAARSAGVPVISVGNITVGGTGKTPLTIEIVRRLRAMGRQPAILTRGYGAVAGQTADEVLEYELTVPDVPVVVDSNRVRGAEVALTQHTADCLVLDDGFQHRRLRRALDIVLIDALNPWAGGWLLPAGGLREPLTNLRRAHWILLTRSNQVEPNMVQDVMALLQGYAPQATIIKTAVEGEHLLDMAGAERDVKELADRRILPVCGIGNPQSFLDLVERLNGIAVDALIFADHHRYSDADVEKIKQAARRQNVEWVVTTRKDWVKLSTLWSTSSAETGDVELLRLDTRMVLADARGGFDRALQGLFEESE
ncbi:MAG: tetraacyldisaccharide 4'-kinase [Planctomycetota bacterium]